MEGVECHYQCRSCGYLFWSAEALFTEDEIICDECKRENEHIEKANQKIEGEFIQWAEKWTAEK